MILVDSSVWIDYFRGVLSPRTDKLDRLLASDPVVIGDLMRAEVLQGFVGEREFKRAGSRCWIATAISTPLRSIRASAS